MLSACTELLEISPDALWLPSYIPHMARVHAPAEYVRVTNGIQNSECARGSRRCAAPRRAASSRYILPAQRETWLSGKEGITMPKRARIVVKPVDTTDNSQCAKCIGIESGRFIFAPTRPGAVRRGSILSFACLRCNICPNQKSLSLFLPLSPSFSRFRKYRGNVQTPTATSAARWSLFASRNME